MKDERFWSFNLIRVLLFSLAVLGTGWSYVIIEVEGHPFYVSVCQVDFNPENRTFQISIKIFTDDFERALEESTDKRLRLGTRKEHEETDEIIRAYFKDRFSIQVNDAAIDLNYLGKEVGIDTTWCYIESKMIPPPVPDSDRKTHASNKRSQRIPDPTFLEGRIRITNQILLETFDNQTNIVHIKIGNQRKSLLLSYARETDSVNF